MNKNQEKIQYEIMNLTKHEAVIFGLFCCTRLVPNYYKFSREAEWGNPKPLEEAIKFICEALESGCHKQDVSIRLQNELELVAPDSEVFRTGFTSYAIDAVASICCVLRYLDSLDLNELIQVSSNSIDTVGMYIQEALNLDVDYSLLELKLSSHEIMVQEISNQLKTLEFLLTNNRISFEEVEAYMSDVLDENVSNIGYKKIE